MHEAVGLDRDYDACFFEIADARFESIAPTTWRELTDAGYLKPVDVRRSTYRLTGTGWIAGLEITGVYSSENVNQRCSALAAALKKRVDRTSQLDEIAGIEDLAIDSKSSKGWCFNVLNSGLLEQKSLPNEWLFVSTTRSCTSRPTSITSGEFRHEGRGGSKFCRSGERRPPGQVDFLICKH